MLKKAHLKFARRAPVN